MKAWMLDPLSQALSLEDRPRPAPGPHQVLIKVKAASLNRGEFLVGMGIGGQSSTPKPCGMEAAGEVLEMGAEVMHHACAPVQIGTRVMGRAPGGFAQYALIDAQDLLVVPDHLGWLDAACVPIAYLVAYDMVIAGGQLSQGQNCLITGISSGVGIASAQIAKLLDATVIGTSSSEHKLERIRALDLCQGILSRGDDFVEAVLQNTDGRGVDLAINNVGASVFAACLKVLAYQGRLAQVGFVDAQKQAVIDLDRLHAQRLKIFGVSNKFRSPGQRAETVRGFAQQVLPWFASGKLRPLIDRVYGFDELPQAQAAMRANTHLGKLVLEISA